MYIDRSIFGAVIPESVSAIGNSDKYCFSLSSLTIQVWVRLTLVLEERNTAPPPPTSSWIAGEEPIFPDAH